jgi:hypothetical protein
MYYSIVTKGRIGSTCRCPRSHVGVHAVNKTGQSCTRVCHASGQSRGGIWVRMAFGNWFFPFNQRHVLAAAITSLNAISRAAGLEVDPSFPPALRALCTPSWKPGRCFRPVGRGADQHWPAVGLRRHVRLPGKDGQPGIQAGRAGPSAAGWPREADPPAARAGGSVAPLDPWYRKRADPGLHQAPGVWPWRPRGRTRSAGTGFSSWQGTPRLRSPAPPPARHARRHAHPDSGMARTHRAAAHPFPHTSSPGRSADAPIRPHSAKRNCSAGPGRGMGVDRRVVHDGNLHHSQGGQWNVTSGMYQGRCVPAFKGSVAHPGAFETDCITFGNLWTHCVVFITTVGTPV